MCISAGVELSLWNLQILMKFWINEIVQNKDILNLSQVCKCVVHVMHHTDIADTK